MARTEFGRDGVMIDPPLHAISCRLASRQTAVNYGARARLAHWPSAMPVQIATTPAGMWRGDGGKPPNSYRYPASASYLTAAWWTDGRGRKHVRIDGCRDNCGTASYGCSASSRYSAGGWADVYPRRAGKRGEVYRARCAKAMDRFGPAQAVEWHKAMDRLEQSLRDLAREPLRDNSLGAKADRDREVAAAYAASTAHRATQPTDDRRRINLPVMLAASAEGLLIGDNRERPGLVHLVVRDATTGYRHEIPVPPKFGRRDRITYQRLGNDRARVHAALAWTFDLQPEQYAPALQA